MPARSARSSAPTFGLFDATPAISRPASIRACKFVPSPETRTPITRSLRSPAPRRAPAGGKPAPRLARRARGAVDQPLSSDDADAGAREVELVLPVDAGQLGRLAADEHAVRSTADLRRAFHEVGDLVEVDRVSRD